MKTDEVNRGEVARAQSKLEKAKIELYQTTMDFEEYAGGLERWTGLSRGNGSLPYRLWILSCHQRKPKRRRSLRSTARRYERIITMPSRKRLISNGSRLFSLEVVGHFSHPFWNSKMTIKIAFLPLLFNQFLSKFVRKTYAFWLLTRLFLHAVFLEKMFKFTANKDKKFTFPSDVLWMNSFDFSLFSNAFKSSNKSIRVPVPACLPFFCISWYTTIIFDTTLSFVA